MSTKDEVPGVSGYQGDYPDAKVDECPTKEEEIPEPEEDIDFLIDNIERENTKTSYLLN